MSRRFPFKSLRVFGSDVPARILPASRLGDKLGTFSGDGISVADGPHATVARVACHELVEAWNYGGELGLSHRQITVLEGLLFETLRANRAFVRFVQWGRWR